MIAQFHYFVSLLVLILGLWHEEANKELFFFLYIITNIATYSI